MTPLRLPGDWPISEYRTPDAQVCRASSHRIFQIGAHAGRDRTGSRVLLTQPSADGGQLVKTRPWVDVQRRHGHDAIESQMRRLSDDIGQFGHASWNNSGSPG